MVNSILKGGEFLLKETESKDVFIPEEFDEEQLMIAQTCDDFLETEVFPNLDRMDSMEQGLMRSFLTKAGELGLLGISIPEEYDGFDQSFVTAMRANEAIGAGYSYAVAQMAHTGIGTMPTLYYGNDEQKKKYLPKLASGEWVASYCLTEPNAGSDANAGSTKAMLSDDGKHYLMNGQKMWITNGGFADIFTVFAKIDNDRVLSAFIVEKSFPGITINPEERKMGIKGSSTTQIFFNDCKVPVENLLGKRGEGFRIALNILHIGRIKLGASVLGAAKRATSQSVNYSNERKQFGVPISSFGAIKHKLAEQAIKAYATESAVYRAANDINDAIEALIDEGMKKAKAKIAGASRFAIECALLKVYGSESLDYVVDETVQIMAGMGYSAEGPADRAYRDSRINRIFEGTNEINRLLIIDTALKSGMKKEINLYEEAVKVLNGIGGDICIESKTDYFEEKRDYISRFKKATLMLIAATSEKFPRQLIQEQEIMMNMGDMMMQTYVAESTLLRVEKLHDKNGEVGVNLQKDILDVLIVDSANIIYKSGFDAISSFAEGESQEKLLKAIKCYTKVAPINVKDARRRIANKMIEENRYCF